jgi:uncharacterized protein
MSFSLGMSRKSRGKSTGRAGSAGARPLEPFAISRYEQRHCGAKGQGICAISIFGEGELVIPGVVVSKAPRNDKYAFQMGPNEFVYEGALKDLVNHSCEPNCGVRRNSRGGLDLIARQVILPDEEITVDYAMHSYVVEYFPERCLCGSPLCRKEVAGWRDLPDTRKAAYAGYIAPFLCDVTVERVPA